MGNVGPLWEIRCGDALDLVRDVPTASVDCIVTSPPYWSLRNYGVDGQLGREATFTLYIEKLLEHAAEWYRVLKDTGTLFINLGDTYSGNRGNKTPAPDNKNAHDAADTPNKSGPRKQLLLIPARVALAFSDAGWMLRNDIIWQKPNAKPESCVDRFTKSHEHIFLFSKQLSYFFNMDDSLEPYLGDASNPSKGSNLHEGKTAEHQLGRASTKPRDWSSPGRHPRDVWTMPTKPFKGAHFAVFPPEIPRKAIRAGCPSHVCARCGAPWTRNVVIEYKWHEKWFGAKQAQCNSRGNAGNGYNQPVGRTPGPWQPACSCAVGSIPGLVLDPFTGSGTTGLVAVEEGRRFAGFEMNSEYVSMATDRLNDPNFHISL
jgi:DNA modification methylase